MTDVQTAPSVDDVTAVPRLRRLGRRYAAFVRCGVGVASALVAPWASPPAGFGATALIAALFAAWSVAYAVRLLRAPAPWWTGADVVIVAGLCLALPLLDSPRLLDQGTSWVIAVAAITVMSLHWHVRPVTAWAATGAITGCAVVAVAVSTGLDSAGALRIGLWLPVESGLSALVWVLVIRGGRAAGLVMARQFDAAQAAELEAARRADQRTHWATLHDTAATTLLMVGNGEVRGDEPWLAKQIERDVAALDGAAADDARVDVGTTLAGVLHDCPSAPEVHLRGAMQVPGRVAAALVGAASEAVENVRRHGGGATARVWVDARSGRIVVTVVDAGRGFDPAAATSGCGLRHSVVERMTAVGGSARVRSAAGCGTTVQLEWAS